MAAIKKTPLIRDYRALRRKLDLNQTEFWNRLGVSQSGGSRYESGRPVPTPVAVLAQLIYVKRNDPINVNELDAREFK